MDCPCAKCGDFSFSHFGFIVRTDRQTDTGSIMTVRILQMRMTDATTVSVSNIAV